MNAPSMDEVVDLLIALRSADGPSPALDMEIARLIGERNPRAYTSSLDAAVSLVPDGYVWAIYSDGKPIIDMCISALCARFGIAP